MTQQVSERKISIFEAVSIVEGIDGEEHDRSEVIDAWQALIDSGIVWSLQGRYGRTAAELINSGVCRVRMQ